jgi:hypothetical protein
VAFGWRRGAERRGAAWHERAGGVELTQGKSKNKQPTRCNNQNNNRKLLEKKDVDYHQIASFAFGKGKAKGGDGMILRRGVWKAVAKKGK